MLLHLMRHGIAIGREDPACPSEPDRHLTSKGVAKTEAVARGLRTLGVQPTLVLTSPYLRSVQTAEIACDALGYPVKKLRRSDALLPEAKPGPLFEELASLRAEEVLCVGHAPNLDLVIAAAVGSRSAFTELKKAGIAGLEMESLSPTKGRLVYLHGPKVLRLVGE